MSNRLYDALPAYMGGKRKLIKYIFREFPKPSASNRMVIGFTGGGSDSLAAKALGYETYTNDLAERSYIIGRALIENNTTRLEERHVEYLFLPNNHSFIGDTPVISRFFLDGHARFVDNAMGNIQNIDPSDPLHWLLKLLVVKFILYTRPHSSFGGIAILEDLKKHKNSSTVIRSKNLHKSTYKMRTVDKVKEFATKINISVRNNGKANNASNVDVTNFLSGLDSSKENLVYLDPPYAGSKDYYTEYWPLDCILQGKLLPKEKSNLNGKSALGFLENMIRQTVNAKYLVLSYGSQKYSKDTIINMVRNVRGHAETIDFHYEYSKAGKYRDTGSKELMIKSILEK